MKYVVVRPTIAGVDYIGKTPGPSTIVDASANVEQYAALVRSEINIQKANFHLRDLCPSSMHHVHSRVYTSRCRKVIIAPISMTPR